MAKDAAAAKVGIPVWVVVCLSIGLFFTAVGVAFLVFASKTDNLVAETTGVVSRVEVEESYRKNRMRRTVLTYVEFEDSDHREFEARSVVNGSGMRHHEGDVVTIHYDPLDPAAGCLIEGDEDRLFMFKLLEALFQYGGAATLAVGVVGFVLYKLRGPREGTTAA